MIMPSAICLGIDIGGTTVKHAIVDSKGTILERESFETGISISEKTFMDKLFCVVNEGRNRGVSGIGVCTLGAVNSITGQILGAAQNLPFLQGLNLKNQIHKIYPDIPVSICNDVHAVAKGERWLGAAQNCENFFCLTLGTGVGGALVINSKLVTGTHHLAGEIGYLDYQDVDNYLEKRVSTKAIVDRAAQLLDNEELDGYRFFTLVKEGNEVCCGVFEQWVSELSRVTANLIITLDLELVIIGGGVSNEKEILIPKIAATTNQMLPQEFRGHTRIVAAKFASEAGILGAVSELLHQGNLNL